MSSLDIKEAQGGGLLSKLRQRAVDDPQMPFTIVLAVGVWLYFAFTIENYASTRTVFSFVEGFAVLGLVALGLTVVIAAGEFDLSIGSTAALSSVIVVGLTDDIGAFAAIGLGVLVASGIGLIQGYALSKLRISSLPFTVGTLMLIRGVSLVVARGETVVLSDFAFGDFLKTRLWILSPASILVIVVVVSLGIFLKYHRAAREIYAIGGARKEALAAGVSLTKPLMLAFLISGATAGLAGAIVGLRSGSAQPLGLQGLLLTGTTAAFIGGASLQGGKGTAFGSSLGAFTLGFLTLGLNFRATPAFIADIWVGALLLVVVLVELGAQRLDDYETRRTLLAQVDRGALRGEKPGGAPASVP